MRPFYHRLNDCRNFIPCAEKSKIKKKILYNNGEKLYNTLLTIYFNQYNNIADKEHMGKNYDPENLLLKCQRINVLKKEEKRKESIAERVKLRRQKSYDEDLFDMSSLESEVEEVKEGKGLKVLTLSKLCTRLLNTFKGIF